jgi:hypothetical protein
MGTKMKKLINIFLVIVILSIVVTGIFTATATTNVGWNSKAEAFNSIIQPCVGWNSKTAPFLPMPNVGWNS